jgi:hypothetical protein
MTDRRSTPPHHPLALFASRAVAFQNSSPAPIDATPDADPEPVRDERRLVATLRGWLRTPVHQSAERPGALPR